MKLLTAQNTIRIYAIVISALLLLSAAFGCQGSPSQPTPPVQMDLVMPEPTDKLVLYVDPAQEFHMELAIDLYKSRFPDVDVEVHKFEGNHRVGNQGWTDRSIYVQTLQNDLLVGEGPDVFTFEIYDFPDINKTMAHSDIFLDLEPLIQSDPDFNSTDYVSGVFDAGMMRSRRLYVPLDYMMLILFTTEETLERNNLTLSRRPGFDELMEQIGLYCEDEGLKENRLLFPLPLTSNIMFPWSGMEILDYENQAVHVAGEKISSIMKAYKRMYKTDMYTPVPEALGGPYEEARMHLDHKILFSYYLSHNDFVGVYTAVSTVEAPVWFTFPTPDGRPVAQPINLAGLRKNTPNQRNAYEFLKILLDEKIQNSLYFHWYPINKEAMNASVRSSAERYLTGFNLDGMITTMIPDDVIDELIELALSANALQSPYATNVRGIIFEEMLPFFEGDREYEECLAKLENKLIIYVGE